MQPSEFPGWETPGLWPAPGWAEGSSASLAVAASEQLWAGLGERREGLVGLSPAGTRVIPSQMPVHCSHWAETWSPARALAAFPHPWAGRRGYEAQALAESHRESA